MPQNVDGMHFRILHQNIAGIFTKTNIIEICLAEMKHHRNDPDIICLTETFIQRGSERLLKLSGYDMVSYYTRSNKQKRGGVCVFARQGLKTTELSFLNEISQDFNFECCGIEIPSQKLIVVCLYRIPQSDTNIFFENLEYILLKYINKNKKIIIAGDININTLEANKNTAELINIAKNYNLRLHIQEPTRGKSCIDHFISNIIDAESKLLHLGLCDHNTAQLLKIPCSKKILINSYYYIFKRDYSSENLIKFRQYMQALSFSEVLEQTNIDDAYNCFNDLFTLIYKLCFPIVRIKIDKRCKNFWISKGIRISCKTKRALHFHWLKSKSNKSKLKYKTYTKLLRACIDRSQKNLNNKMMQKSKNKCKTSWNIIKKEYGIAHNNEIIKEIIIEGNIITDQSQIANAFNKKFTFKKDNSNLRSRNLNSSNCSSIFLRPCSKDEIFKTIMTLNNTKAVGFDEVATEALKACASEVSTILAYLINFSFSSGTFPKLLKQSVVKPIHKKGLKTNIENYRPITLISVISKLFEAVMYKRLTIFFTKNNLIKKEQFGFQKGKSTEMACFDLFSRILSNIDEKKKYCVCVSVF